MSPDTQTSPAPFDVRITALRQTAYADLSALYELPLAEPCTVRTGDSWVSHRARRPESLCPVAWECMRRYVEELAAGRGRFHGNWMRNPYSALVNCNDGFRPMSFLLEALRPSAPTV